MRQINAVEFSGALSHLSDAELAAWRDDVVAEVNGEGDPYYDDNRDVSDLHIVEKAGSPATMLVQSDVGAAVIAIATARGV